MATYWKFPIKCLNCGLHFAVFSDYEDWPDKGTTREQMVGEATGVVYCPECGGTTRFITYREEQEGFIFQQVPGAAEMLGLKMGEHSGDVPLKSEG
jgi:predicted RNA-binding Zn-ribbon protein involved in translation (DUF1610 family)